MAPVLCIGIGNLYRQDDAVGLCVAHALQALNLPGVRVIEHSGEGVSLMDSWRGAGALILIDAVSSGAAPGSIFQFAVHDRPLPAGYFAFSTHAFGLAGAIELARSLGELPPQCIVFGIEGVTFDFGIDLSPQIAQSAREIIPVIVRTIERLQDGD